MTYIPKKGDYVLTGKLSKEAITRFIDDMLRAGAKAGTPLGMIEEREYFGWDLRDNSIYAYHKPTVANRTLFNNNVTAHYQGVTAMPIRTRNPFQNGDLVVPNGYKVKGTEHYYCTNDKMRRWEANNQLLVVTDSHEPDRVSVKPHDYTILPTPLSINYHPSELRMATAEEIAKADEPKQPALKRGMVIKAKDNGAIAVIARPHPDDDGDVRVCFVTGRNVLYFRLSRGYEILGQIMEDGDYRPAATISTANEG